LDVAYQGNVSSEKGLAGAAEHAKLHFRQRPEVLELCAAGVREAFSPEKVPTVE
jgi:hypothetical protein